MIIDNQDIAILTRVNELAERFGMKPYDLTAQVNYNDKTNQSELEFTTVAKAATSQAEAMLDAIAGPKGMSGGVLSGEVKEIIDALDQAIAKAPRLRVK